MTATALEEIDVCTPHRKWPTYPGYKPSGMVWVRHLPKHWRVFRLKNVASVRFSSVDKKSEDGETPVRLCNYTDVYNNDRIANDPEFMQATANKDEIARFTLKMGDVLITKDSEEWNDIAVPAYVTADMPGVLCGYHLAHIRPRPTSLDGAYLSRAFTADGIRQQFHVAANGITRYGLPNRAIAGALFPVPPLDEQRAIAAFLDHEMARIDELIWKKQAMIDRLAEKRSVIVSRAITNGIDPTDLKPIVGMEWLPALPSHWQLKRLKYVADLQTGLTLGKKYPENTELTQRPYLRVANVQDGFLDLSEITTVQVPPADIPRYELHPGDVLMTEGGDFDKLGRGYVWDGQIDGCLHQNHIFAVRPRPTLLDSRFLATLLSSSHGRNYFTSTSQQTTNLASTNSTKLKEFPIPLPPKHEQLAIMEAIGRASQVIDDAMGAVQIAIRKLHEHRASLITAAVTGQIDVRNYRREAACP